MNSDTLGDMASVRCEGCVEGGQGRGETLL